jgi:hypothetical protein
VLGVIEPGEVADVCVPESDQICSPCVEDTECSIVGVDLCLDYPDGKSFCSRDCSAVDCPAGYTCTTVDVGGTDFDQCIPDSGACDCDASTIGTMEPCTIDTDFGPCTGARTCEGGTGWGACLPPSGSDVPDGAFIDDNCDGIDGTLDGGIFVSTSVGTDSGTCGLTYMDPCQTIAQGIVRAAGESRGAVYIMAGSYSEVVVMLSGIDLYGGYDVGWQRDDHSDPDHRVTITGGLDSGLGGDNEYLTIRAHNLVVETLVADVVIVGPNASGTTSGNGRGSYAVHADSAALKLERVTISAGNGAIGGTGSTGMPTSSASAAQGGSNGGGANEFTTTCNDSSHGGGGSRGTNSCGGGRNPNGGNGGNGGEMDTNCDVFSSNFNATSGDGGANASYINGSAGLGGGGGSGGDSCGTPSPPGRDGYVANGGPGAGATNREGLLIGSYWYARAGGSGSLGQNGGGGGGGGGSGGCDVGIDSYGAGGGGGGAGGCRATSGGGGGGGGGGSFGIFAANSSVVDASACTITRGNAADGGQGGPGGHGQRGGSAGSGGTADGDSKAGGNGGKGAHGGHGGGGGGGAGGLSVGVFTYSATVTHTCTIAGGSGGGGGIGGVSAPAAPPADSDGNDGTSGISGALRDTDSCAAPGGC